MATVYRIARWSEVFEKSDANKLKVLTWVSMPVEFGDGYHAMLDEFGDDQPAAYGAWCALVALAARMPNRGTFANSRGAPVSLTRLARETHMPADLLERVIKWASSQSVRWIEVVESSEILGDSPKVSEDFTTTRHGQDLTKPFTNERKGERPSDFSEIVVTEGDRESLAPWCKRIAAAAGQRMLPKDREMVWRAAAVAVKRLETRWLDKVLTEIASRPEPPRRPWAYIAGALKKSAEARGWDWHEARDAVRFEFEIQPAEVQ